MFHFFFSLASKCQLTLDLQCTPNHRPRWEQARVLPFTCLCVEMSQNWLRSDRTCPEEFCEGLVPELRTALIDAIGEKVEKKSIPILARNPLATSLAFNLSKAPFARYLTLSTILESSGRWPLGSGSERTFADLRVLVFLSQLRSTFRGVEMARSSWGPSVRVLLCELCPCWWFLIARQLILGAHDTMGQNSLVNDETVAFQRYIVYGIELFNYVGHLPVVLENLPFCVIGPLYSFTLSSLLCTIRPPFW